jgi:hypothetical protein
MGAAFVVNTCVALFVVTLVAFVCNIIATNPTYRRNSAAIRDSSSWDNGRVTFLKD